MSEAAALSDLPVSRILSALLSRGGEHGELFFEETRSLTVLMEDGRIERVVSGTDAGIGVRLLFRGKTYYAYTNDRSTESLLALSNDLSRYAEGDGVIEFLGPVEGYGVFIQDGSVDVSGDFTWGGYFQAMARSDEEDPDQELGRVFEVHGDATITGGVLFNMPKGYATLGDLDPDPFNNYGFVARGEDSTIRYSQEALELAAEGLTTITRRITRLYAFHIFHID